ncbi:unnamed protein product [Fusarium graminearum]|nr:unnamed protein product [Fusarium graminearum]
MKPSVILSTSVFAGTTVARLYKRDELVARADSSSSFSTASVVANPTDTGTDGGEETLSTDTGAPATVSTTASSASMSPTIPSTYDCLSDCNSNYDKCRTTPGANMSTCAAQYAGCLGYNPFQGGSLVTPTACSAPASDTPKPTQSGTSDCVTGCNDDYNKCRTAPGANMSTCAAQYAGCLGYNPFEGGSLVTPTACSVTASETSKPTQSGTSDCLNDCNNKYDKCRTAPGANMATCASEYAGCLGYNPFEGGSLVAPTACSDKAEPTQSGTDECVKECNSDYDKCRTAPDANMSTCAAQYSQCLGYNPFDGSGSLATPTACSSGAGTTATDTGVVQSSMASQSPSPLPDTTMQMTGTYENPVVTCTSDMCAEPTMTESPVVVDGAESLRPWMPLVALVALAVL